MKKDIHPNYREVLFEDISCNHIFKIRSTIKTDQTKEHEGETLPYVKLDISSASHPFYTGKQKILDTEGRIEKFQKKFGSFGKSKK